METNLHSMDVATSNNFLVLYTIFLFRLVQDNYEQKPVPKFDVYNASPTKE